MKLLVTNSEWGGDDYPRESIELALDGKVVFCVGDGEPEDMNLRRDLKDCRDVPELMRKAHAAGVRGEPFDVEVVNDQPACRMGG